MFKLLDPACSPTTSDGGSAVLIASAFVRTRNLLYATSNSDWGCCNPAAPRAAAFPDCGRRSPQEEGGEVIKDVIDYPGKLGDVAPIVQLEATQRLLDEL